VLVADPLEYLTTVVRVFPDYADTVLWFAPGPVSYEDACVSRALAADMAAWEARYYRILDDDCSIRPTVREPFEAEGRALARRLSAELGDAFAVECVGDSGGHLLLRGDGPGTNPRAVAAFRRMADDELAVHARIQHAMRDGEAFRWVAAPRDER
jgi:hypothetical protein